MFLVFRESWTDTTNSHNHPALSATFSKYLYSLAGIDLEDPAVWLEHRLKVFVDPGVAAMVGSAEGTVETSAGPVSTRWSVDSNSNLATLAAAVPVSFSAELHVVVPPACRPEDVQVVEQWSGKLVYDGRAGGVAASTAMALGYDGASLVQHTHGGHTVRFVARSGHHAFYLHCGQ